jgi:hypothetical protein
VIASESLLAAFVPGNSAVESEADGVEDARLSGAGPTGDQEDAVIGELVEVHDLSFAERAESFDLQSMQSHQSILFAVGASPGTTVTD